MTASQSLYRPEAIAYRLQRQRAVAPPDIPDHGRTRLMLGATLVLLIVLGITTFLRPVANQVTGLAIAPSASAGTQVVALLLDPETTGQLRPGQTVSLAAAPGHGSRTATISTVEPERVDTVSLASTLGLDPRITASLPETLTLAWLTLDDQPPLAPGDVLRAETTLGTSRAGTVLPLIGTWFGA